MEGKRDQEMHQTKNGKNYYFGTKAPIGADAESGLVYHVHDTTRGRSQRNGSCTAAAWRRKFMCADTGYTGVEKRPGDKGRLVIY